ncbi:MULTISPECIES: DUF3533 domain-containing protein [unclassified Streptomyces]|uniref:DUF3533 domain-containing protein n=1 Tax=unclassified Streptomyces TaxID=2593676 RepID=UPI000DB999EC|nr:MULTISPECIES: DUF3533 domain-containing protein [unclassified Streptomyces]MYT72820.1 DUF3533 domain-containing protein [Streptomyces sp. SID8367]RAJ78796.1 hypothetical protein K377_05402 [Streptomyces sp. PsTaAH-137]
MRFADGFAREFKDAVTPRAALLVIGVLALQLLFIASYVGALHSPKPKDVPFGVVGPTAAVAQQTEQQLAKLSGSPLDPRVVSDAATAKRKILDREIDGALILNARGTTDTLLVASGGGTVLASALENLAGEIDATQQRTIRAVDVAPASAKDFDGLSAFYLVVGWCVGGYLCASIMSISAGSKPTSPPRALIRLGTMALVAIAGGIGGSLIIGDSILGALPGSFWGLAGLGALVTFAVGALTLALEELTGIVGIGLAVLVVVVAGNPSAGGAFPLPMLPPFWQAIGPWLPPGAGTWAARSIAYFHGNAMTRSLLVLAAWAVLGMAVTLLVSAWREKKRATSTPPEPAPL